MGNGLTFEDHHFIKKIIFFLSSHSLEIWLTFCKISDNSGQANSIRSAIFNSFIEKVNMRELMLYINKQYAILT